MRIVDLQKELELRVSVFDLDHLVSAHLRSRFVCADMGELLNEWSLDDKGRRARVGQSVTDLPAPQEAARGASIRCNGVA